MAALSKNKAFSIFLSAQLVILIMYLKDRNLSTISYVKTNQAAQSVVYNTTLFNSSFGFNSNSVDQTLKVLPELIRSESEKRTSKNKRTGVGNTRSKADRNLSAVGSENDGSLTSSEEREPVEKPGTFQPIDRNEEWVYSAFYDHVAAQNGHPMVRIFGLVTREFLVKTYCHFSRDNSAGFTTFGIMTDLPEAHNRRYFPAYLTCGLPDKERPTHVSVSLRGQGKPTNRLQIIYPRPRIRNFTVCYSVLHRHYNNKTQLIESIEMNRILGAEHFMVYNYSISPEVDQILRRYQQDGLVTVLQWPVPTNDTWYCGQMLALNDCFYRNRNTSMFVVIVDTDELIIPRSSGNWMELIHNASSQEIIVSSSASNGDNLASCFVFKTCFFPLDNDALSMRMLNSYKTPFTGDEMNIISKYNITLLSKYIRHQKIFQYNIRSKYIAHPDAVQVAGVHYVFNLTSNDSCVNVSENLALVHHYRTIAKDLGKIILDTNALQFRQRLLEQVVERWGRLKTVIS